MKNPTVSLPVSCVEFYTNALFLYVAMLQIVNLSNSHTELILCFLGVYWGSLAPHLSLPPLVPSFGLEILSYTICFHATLQHQNTSQNHTEQGGGKKYNWKCCLWQLIGYLCSLARKTFFKLSNVNSWDWHLNIILQNIDASVRNFQSLFSSLASYADTDITGSAEMKDYLKTNKHNNNKTKPKATAKENVVVTSIILPPWSTSLFEFFLWTILFLLSSPYFEVRGLCLCTLKTVCVCGINSRSERTAQLSDLLRECVSSRSCTVQQIVWQYWGHECFCSYCFL